MSFLVKCVAYYQDRIYTGMFFMLPPEVSKRAYLKFVKAGYDRKILMYGYDKSISNNKGRAIDIIHTVSGADLY